MIKILTVIGARPQIIKAAAITRAIRNNFSEKIKEVIVHTGQHYDDNMSRIFFEEMDVPEEDYNLHVGSGSHATQTALMMNGLEVILLKEKPDCVVLYGDTNSTLAGALAASKLHIPVAHVEAGLRSFNKHMPEEINRICCDHVSTLLFSPTKAGLSNLLREGFKPDNKHPYTSDNPKIYHCGDVMYDNSIYFRKIAMDKTEIVKKNNLVKSKFILVTVHRDTNTDDPEKLNSLFSTFNEISKSKKVDFVIPLHPRTSKMLNQKLEPDLFNDITKNQFIKIIPPVSFFEMILLESECLMVMTDSGGVQKEAYFYEKPCIILREETEWVELVEQGCAALASANKKEITRLFEYFSNKKDLKFPQLFGDGHAAEFICREIVNNFSN